MGITGTGSNGVCLLGEAWGKVEASRQLPFQGPAGAKLAKMLGMLGYERDEFLMTNVYWAQPPSNRDPTDAEVNSHRHLWEPFFEQPTSIKVIVPLGNVPLRAVLDLEGIQGKRGYLWWSERYQLWVLPTVHPAFILRGNAHWTAIWLRDVQQAVETASQGPPAAPRRALTLDPSPAVAQEWVGGWNRAQRPPLAFDIETPGADKDDEDKAEVASGEEKGTIYRIGFAWRVDHVTHALSIPWGAGFDVVVQSLLAVEAPRVVWNRHFDVPRLRAHGHVMPGPIHDAQEMWHVLHSDLPKRLEFVAPVLVPGQVYWKNLIHERPAFYNAVDAAVTIEAFEALYGLAA